jgi:cytochrome d ubiquinol oxidase subunit II
MAEVVAVILWTGITAYAVLGGADFGSGFWDLVAGGAERGRRPRALIDIAIGPVWEANHVWLIFCLVVLWTAFPTAFAAIMTTLFVPLMLAAMGIVFRGAGFAFRKVYRQLNGQRLFGAAFALSSVITPFFLGTVAGSIASGRVEVGVVGDPITSWVNPTSLMAGVLAVTVCAYLAAVFLTSDARREDDPELEAYFGRRAIWAAATAGLVALVGIEVLSDDAPLLFEGLTHDGLPFVLASVAAGGATLVLLIRGAHRLVRPLSVVAVASIVWGWGIAQDPYLLPDSLTIEQAAGADAALGAVVVVFILAALIIGPSLGLLFWLDQKSLLDPEDLPPAGDAESSTPAAHR